MRDVSRLRWLSGRLWALTLGAIFFVLYGMLPWHNAPYMSFSYLWLSRLGVLTAATVERNQGHVHPEAMYSFTTPDGVRHQGRAKREGGSPGEELLVYYLPDDPEASIPRNQWMELEQMAIGVLLGLACATSIVVRIRRRPA